VEVLDPASDELGAAQVAALRVVRLDRFATSVRPTAFGLGAARPAVDPAGRYAFVRFEGTEVDAGTLWVSSALDDAGEAIVVAAGGGAATASFAPEPGSMVIGEAVPGGVWLLDLAGGDAEPLIADGWLPRWVP
jgi:hypothetical protein